MNLPNRKPTHSVWYESKHHELSPAAALLWALNAIEGKPTIAPPPIPDGYDEITIEPVGNNLPKDCDCPGCGGFFNHADLRRLPAWAAVYFPALVGRLLCDECIDELGLRIDTVNQP